MPTLLLNSYGKILVIFAILHPKKVNTFYCFSVIFIIHLAFTKKAIFYQKQGFFREMLVKRLCGSPAPFYLCTVSSRRAWPTMAS